MKLVAVAATAALVGVLGVPAALAGTPTLNGTDGPGFTITLSSKSVKAGSYTITVKDKSNIHNFHLTGPGVNKKTSVGGQGTSTWKLKLKKGTYKFVCDPHKSFMKGSFTVS